MEFKPEIDSGVRRVTHPDTYEKSTVYRIKIDPEWARTVLIREINIINSCYPEGECVPEDAQLKVTCAEKGWLEWKVGSDIISRNEFLLIKGTKKKSKYYSEDEDNE